MEIMVQKNRGSKRDILKLEYEQVAEMLEISVKTMEANIAEVKTALNNNDYQSLGKVGHTLKGSLLNLGLNDIARIAETIESNGKNNISADYNLLLSQLKEGLGDLLVKIESA